MAFGDKLREYRQAKDISLRKLAKALNISAPYLSDIERNKRMPPSAKKIKEICDILFLNIEEMTSFAATTRYEMKMDCRACPYYQKHRED